ncbi:LytR/AlgR family response regulator transcription factor [Mucilaginibacter ginsenosidivorax]|uniref:Response regulator transcription factor n=1 Tax=Mucilaginibacter ginsenosidivorax TaxID=862126 RepID=A0A5B8WA24_9SPHI|nr:LytTR family DNA-binding domain-containing protein [Mucilaginibacter ginsenosidivorax]QEC79826.1 response regulator transcription factor [Mucilaginibacter ginsenosidivorax]
MILNCLIVDDEPIARDILRAYISQVPYLNLAGECRDAFEAMQVINRQPVNLIILDINMPRLSGLDMLRTLKKYPAIIITSAYPEYALEGFELSVTDYLLKPFSFPRFVQATEKALTTVNPSFSSSASTGEKEDFLMVKSDKKLTKVFFYEITYVEAYGNYIFIYREQDRIMSKQTLTQFQEQLPGNRFVRIHKSYIISLHSVKFIEGNEVSIGTKKLPVGKVYKDNLLKKLQ